MAEQPGALRHPEARISSWAFTLLRPPMPMSSVRSAPYFQPLMLERIGPGTRLNAIYFISPMKGWIVGEFGLVLHTEDGGSTWTAQRSGSDLPQLYSVKFVDDQRGWAIGQAGSLIRTTDGGKRWATVEIDSKRDLYNISIDGQRCIIVGDGIAFGSDDAGSSWKEIRLNSEDQWLAGVLVKNRAALAVGRGGTI